MKAMIMAAGLGTRLRPLTEVIAKPSAPVANRPIMEHVVRLLCRHGITDVSCNLHYHPEAIIQHFGAGESLGVTMRFIVEDELSGTAGGVGRFRDHLSEDTFVIMSADAMTDADLSSLLAAHRASGGIASIAVKSVDDPSRYGVVVHDDDGRITGFQEKPSREEARSNLCNCGIYVFEPEIFRYIPPDAFVDFGHDVFPALLADDAPFHIWRCESYWNDVGDLNVYREANADALSRKVVCDLPGVERDAGVRLGAGSDPRPGAVLNAPLVAGEACTIESDARLLGPVVLGDGCRIGVGALVDRAVLWDAVTVGKGARAAGCVLGRGVVLEDGAVVGEGAVVADGCRIAAGVTVPPGARLQPGTVVSA